MTKRNYSSVGKILIAISFLAFLNFSIAQEVPQVLAVIYDQDDNKARIGSTIGLQVANLSDLREDNKTLVPFLDGLPLEEVNMSFPEGGTVEFVLQRTGASKDSWDNVILRRSKALSTAVSVSIGVVGSAPIDSQAALEIELVNKNYAIIFGVLLIIILTLFLYCAIKSNIIRDSGKEPEDRALRKPFSISKVQMSIWFFLIIGAYPFIYLITGDLSSISSSLLGLMGISAGTALGAAVIDDSKGNSNSIERLQLESEKSILSQRVTDLENNSSAAGDPSLMAELAIKKARSIEVERSLGDLPNFTKAKSSGGFFKDLVSDAGGVSFHRFQIFAWTLVLAIIFISEVVTNLQMPEFSATLLGLMGVSSGTYIGFKFPEKPKMA